MRASETFEILASNFRKVELPIDAVKGVTSIMIRVLTGETDWPYVSTM